MKKILLLLIFTLNILFAQNIVSDKESLENTLFPYADEKFNGICLPKCRAVKDGYATQIHGFDATSGVTECLVYSVNDLSKSIGFYANTKNQKCVEQTNLKIEYGTGQLSSEGKNYHGTSKLNYDPKTYTFSEFMAGLLTLDPAMIKFSETNATGVLTLQDPGSIYGSNIVGLNPDKKQSEDPQLVATVDSLNKANLGYFSNLFANMSQIYSHVQNLLVVFVGMFFLGTLGVGRLSSYLDKSGEGQKSPWLNKFAVPLVASAFFFIPIPEEADMNATVVQKIMRYFAYESASIANRASTIGIQTYMQKLYSTVGAKGVEGEKVTREEFLSYQAQYPIYKSVLDNFCNPRYPKVNTYQYSDIEIEEQAFERWDINKVGSTITFKACRDVERSWLLASKKEKELGRSIEQLKKAYNSNALQTQLSSMNQLVDNAQNELGWMFAPLIPSLGAVVLQLDAYDDNMDKKTLEEEKDNTEKIYQETKDAHDSRGLKTKIEDGIASGLGGAVGFLTKNLAYFVLPGASGIYQTINSEDKDGNTLTVTLASYFPPFKAALAIPGVKTLVNSAQKIGSLFIIAWIYDYILEVLPIVVGIVAGIIAILAYIVELAKLYYVSPFVVAFALSTRKTDKIVNFLITFIAVMFKPLLIVIFVFFAIFIHTLVYDVFMTFIQNMFLMFYVLNDAFLLSITLGLFEVLLQIIASIGCIYIMWKLILTGPSWTLKLVGIDSHGDIVSDSLSNKLERYSFQL